MCLTASHFAWLLVVGQSSGELVVVETSSWRCYHMQGVAL